MCPFIIVNGEVWVFLQYCGWIVCQFCSDDSETSCCFLLSVNFYFPLIFYTKRSQFKGKTPKLTLSVLSRVVIELFVNFALKLFQVLFLWFRNLLLISFICGFLSLIFCTRNSQFKSTTPKLTLLTLYFHLL